MYSGVCLGYIYALVHQLQKHEAEVLYSVHWTVDCTVYVHTHTHTHTHTRLFTVQYIYTQTIHHPPVHDAHLLLSTCKTHTHTHTHTHSPTPTPTPLILSLAVLTSAGRSCPLASRPACSPSRSSRGRSAAP